MENVDMQNIRQVLGITFDAFIEDEKGNKIKRASSEIFSQYMSLQRTLVAKYDSDEITDEEYSKAIKSLNKLYAQYRSMNQTQSAPTQESDFIDIKDFVDPNLLQDSIFLGFLDRYKANLKTKADIEAFVERYKTEKRELASKIFGDNVDYIDEDLLGSETFKKYYDRYGVEDYTPDELADFIKQYRKDVLQEIPEDIGPVEKTEAEDPGIW